MEGIKTYKGMVMYNELNSIPDLNYEGYVWMSDQPEPSNAKNFDFKDVKLNPFIQEALLYCAEKNISVMIRHTGDYRISEFHLNDFPEEYELVEKQYFPHRLGFNDKRVCMSQLWISEIDDNCAYDENKKGSGMEVLTLKAHIFTGFKEPKKIQSHVRKINL